MKNHLRATAHIYVTVFAITTLLYATIGCRLVSEWGVPALLAGGGAVVAGPVGAVGGAALGVPAGEKVADIVQPPEPPPPTTVNNIDNKGGTVNVAAAHAPEEPWYAPWVLWAKLATAVLGILLLIPRTRPHVLGFLYSALHAHPGAALAKAGATLGLVHSATADGMLRRARAARGNKVPPAVVISTEQKPHAS